jgi:hypothetical protein
MPGFFPPRLREGVAADRIYRLLDREPYGAALAVGALALVDVRTVGPVFMATVSAAQDVDVLVVVRAGMSVGRTTTCLFRFL